MLLKIVWHIEVRVLQLDALKLLKWYLALVCLSTNG